MASPTDCTESLSRDDLQLLASRVSPPAVPESEVSKHGIRTLETSWENLTGEDDRTDQTEQVQVGMAAETKNLYREGRRDAWQEWKPEDHGFNFPVDNPSSKFCLIVRREGQPSDTDQPFSALDSITVQSPIIKKQLGPVFKDYKGINTNLKKLDFYAPFREFYYRWNEFVEARPVDDETSSQELAHYNLFFDIIAAEIRPHIDQAADLLKNNVISYDYLWTIFEPDTEIYSEIDGHERLFIVETGKYEKSRKGSFFNLRCRYVDTDGSSFGYHVTSLIIWEFSDLKPIIELEAIPSRLKPGIDDIRARLIRRGRAFEALKGMHHKSYTGKYQLARPSPGAPYKQFVTDERVMIDQSTFSEYNDDGSGPLEAFNDRKSPRPSSYVGDSSDSDSESDSDFSEPDLRSRPKVRVAPPPVPRGLVLQRPRRMEPCVFSSGKPTKDPDSENEPLSELHYSLCSHLVRGFCLNAKTWGFFDVDLVQDISWSDAAFNQLVLPGDYKRIIRAFVDAQMSGIDGFEDVIKGKGRGFIMLLSGAPGTGKTLTAESVAETMRKPLYGLGAGELGNQVIEVENNLNRILDLSSKWGAVLLLDECDIFLEARQLSDLQRNKLVSIFLRLLEYYQGVMFLTTNRVSAFDPAFESRIHLTIQYPNLDEASRLHIWQNFVRPDSKSCKILETELQELAKADLNGREIKNVVKTARLLAASEKLPLSLSHFDTVLKIKQPSFRGVTEA